MPEQTFTALPPAFKGYYDAYITSVSPSAMALSFESLQTLWSLLLIERPSRVLEYGSGISTCLLAMYASQNPSYIQSFDSDQEWCDKTRLFLEDHELSQIITISQIDSVEPIDAVEFIIWDFDSGMKREIQMADAFSNLSSGGVMYVDDMHSSGIENFCNSLGGERIMESPRDGFGRFGVFIRKLNA